MTSEGIFFAPSDDTGIIAFVLDVLLNGGNIQFLILSIHLMAFFNSLTRFDLMLYSGFRWKK
jgi:hypothetical protein